ncbi:MULTISPECIES: DMT family transporter [unclassified Wenzhouxiangella]|uniref:DMT family transporter n=1 Tax=unclassified Wenzhouxiangella TaxID=2613841 RepID=UPI000E326CAE|nr:MULTISPECIES: DMT family transporter [unclassified Wenzhouxiangella]RFF26654.1 DMT family transporter [Wenzhouxiangella sp. 15181]RFP67595.1 DMT family transporter [Wenzhouxiangella sp. 15190]
MGEFFSVACAACWALAVVLFRRSGETLPAFELNLFKNLLAAGLMVPTILLVDGISWPGYSLLEWLIVILSGIVGIAIADTWYLRALNLMGASRTGVTASLYSPFVIVLSILFLGEVLLWWQYFGFVLVLGGILLVTWRQNRRDVSLRAIRLGVGFGAGAVLLMASGIVMVKPILETQSFMWTMGVRLAAGAGGMLLFLHWTQGWQRALDLYRSPQPWGTIVVASLLGSYVSMMLWLAGYKLTLASVASVLNETAAAFIVLFAWLFLKEDMNWRRVAGIAMTFSGVGLMVAF